jgi:hypothetical protein
LQKPCRIHIIRAYFSQECLAYIREQSKVVYRSKDGKQTKTFDALEWLVAMCSHVPNRGEQMVRYYGYYSNASRGKRKKKKQIMSFRQSWSQQPYNSQKPQH